MNALAAQGLLGLLATALVGFAYGVGHGLAPDHCAALATVLTREPDRRTAVSASVRFGVGHAATLALFAAIVGTSGWLIPPAWERGAEIMGGALLALLGAAALARGLPVVVHRHAHEHHAREHEHAHWHAHVGAPRRHRHVHATVLGGVFALSGARAMAIAVAPLLLAGRSPAGAVTFVLAFGAGVTAAMIAFGLLVHAGQRRAGAGRRDLTSALVGLVSLTIGACWIAASL
jgi:ABC-type nickel/cobalt efflux system permease component RcnA